MNINKLIHGPNVAGQSLVDRVMAAKHSLAGQGLAKSVCKATTEEISPPKKKHVDYLVQCTNEPNVSVPQMAGLLLERAQNSSWVVVYKALLTSHSLMNYGNEKFTQYLASNNCSFKLENFTDKSSPQGYDMSPFVRRYARYLNEKAFSYRQMAFDFCKVKKGKDDGVLRVMEADKLLKALPALQGQVDKLLEFEVTKSDMNNMVIRACFMMLFKDLIRLLACYNDAIINLLAKFFEMNRKQCKEALDLYKKFVTRMEGVEKFFKVAESVGIEKGDIPDLAQAPSTLLDALETHMKSLESSKKGSKPGESVTSAISNLAAAAQSAGNAQTSDENMENYFFDIGYESEEFPSSSGSNNPFASADTAGTGEGADLTFDHLESSTSAQRVFPCDDLLGLSDPFAEIADEGPSSQANNPFLAVAADDVEDPWSSPAPFGGVSPSHVATSNSFATDEQFAAAFDAAFDNQPSSGGDASQGVTGLATTPSGRAPSPSAALFGLDMSKTSALPRSATPELDFVTGLVKPATPVDATGRISPAGRPHLHSSETVVASPIHQTRQKSSEKLIKGDLDTSIALLADSLTIQPTAHVKKTDHNWTGSEEKRLTGGSTSIAWSHQTTTTTTTFCSTSAVSSAQARPHQPPAAAAGTSPSKNTSSLPAATMQQAPAAEIDLFGDLLGN